MKIVLVGAVALAVIVGIWLYRKRFRRSSRQLVPFVIPPDAVISPAPLIVEEEVALYNLLRMVVQEQYLVFTQVPLWSFIAVDAPDTVRSHVLRHLALKRVDFALVHPGSCHVEQVVQIEQESPQPHQAERQRVIESVLDAAGIKLMKLRSKKTYSLPDLAAQLGMNAEE
ncbi:MAG: DUF2726 domain-containing protein [Nitrospira sp.]|jgi:hypothetical protein|nr:DUF2726 domain-containing protein [Nitrospira sp. BO4]